MSTPFPGQDRPFIIWTLQRTGGTNLTKHLAKRTPFKPIHAEPFNKPRIYGEVSKAWLADRNPEALRASVAEVVAKNECIKHCVEMVPLEVSRALAELSAGAGWRHMFLYRRDPRGRILSKEYAERTKVWGPSHIDKAENDSDAFVEPLDVEQLLKEETRNVDWLNRISKQLSATGATVATMASYAWKWVTGSERAAYRGGCRSLPELPKGTIRHEEDYRHHRLSSAGICG